jgi:hypothetical protein
MIYPFQIAPLFPKVGHVLRRTWLRNDPINLYYKPEYVKAF